jgi:ABC-type sugar transport system ATPase subunit
VRCDFPCAVDRPDGPITIGIRPEQIEVAAADAAEAVTLIVDVKEAIEPDTLLIFQNPGSQAITLRTQTNCDSVEAGQPMSLRFPKQALHYFDAVSGQRVG